MYISFISQTNVLCGWVSVHGVHVLVSYPFPAQDYISQSFVKQTVESRHKTVCVRMCVCACVWLVSQARPNQPQHRSLSVSRILKAIHTGVR